MLLPSPVIYTFSLPAILTTGGRIDMAHHDTKADISLDEAVEFAKAIKAAVDLTDEEDTLIVVTADHAHTLSFSGYAVRGNDIFGKNNITYSDSHQVR
jgi:alkaline phosphatase